MIPPRELHKISMVSKYMRLLLFLILILLNYIALSTDHTEEEGAKSMHIEFTTEGGIAFFPGLSKPVIIDAERLPEIEVRKLRELVDTAHFFDQPTHVGTAVPGAADYKKYTITIKEDERQHTVHLTDPVEDKSLQNLIKFLTTKAREQRIQERKNPLH
jgi:hypothetical protein